MGSRYRFAVHTELGDVRAESARLAGKALLVQQDAVQLLSVPCSQLEDATTPALKPVLTAEHPIDDYDCSSSHVLVASNSTAALYTLSGTLVRTLYRSPVGIKRVLFNHALDTGEFAVLLLENNKLVYINTNEITSVKSSEPSNDSISELAFSADGSLLFTGYKNGELSVWDLTNDELKRAQVIRGLLPVGSAASIISSTDPSTFIASNRSGTLSVVERNSWKVVEELPIKHTQACFYKNGAYIACLDDDNNLCVWDAFKHKRLLQLHVANATKLFVSRGSSSGIAVIAEDGKVHYFSTLTKSSKELTTTTPTSHSSYKSKSVKREPGAVTSSRRVESIESGDNLRSDPVSSDAEVENGDDYSSEDTDFIVDDDGAGYKRALDTAEQINDYYDNGTKSLLKKLNKKKVSVRFDDAPVHAQSIVTPGSTPIQGDRFYLAFNMTGVVYAVKTEDDFQNINIEFHDNRRPTYLKDFHSFTLGSLNSEAAVFATSGSAGANAKLLYQPVADSSKETWSFDFDDDEFVQALAITLAGPVVASSKGYLRFFTNTGMQSRILCFEGSLVGLVSSDTLIFLVYQLGSGHHGSLPLHYKLFQADGELMFSGSLPISSEATVSWIGISNIGNPVTYDSAGVMRMMFPFDSYAWTPVLELKEKNSVHWPVGIEDDKFFYVECAPGRPYPGLPTPLVSEMDLKLPLLNITNDFVASEETWLRKSILNSHKMKAIPAELVNNDVEKDDCIISTDTMLLKLVVSACKAGESGKAVSLCGMLTDAKLVDVAIKFALHLNMNSIAQQFADIKDEMGSTLGKRSRASLIDRPMVKSSRYD